MGASSPGGFSIDIPIPGGLLRHDIAGQGLKVTRESAFYLATYGPIGQLRGQLCNWRIDFSYKDQEGHEYQRERGPTIPECAGGWEKQVAGEATPRTVNYGKACAELFANGKRLAAQCHDIVRSRGI
jgi:hypothetical protein